MKKVNFFNFPSYNIDIKKYCEDSLLHRKYNKYESKKLILKTKFSSCCKFVNISNEKINFKVTFKSVNS